LFPEDKAITDVTDRRNSLNRFVAYHIIDRMLDENEFIPSSWATFYVNGTVLTDYVETLANRLIEVQTGPVFNKRSDGTAIALISQGDQINATENGVIHEIDRILTYDGVEESVLNKRIRMDVACLLPEMATNKLRGSCLQSDDKTYQSIPKDFFRNLTYTESTQLHYCGSAGWADCQGDEFLFVGKYDFTLRLPPVPPGLYEVRIGYTANSQRGVAQMYLDHEPCGIPLNMTILASNANIGWVADDPNNMDAAAENDKMMRNRGYMKGPNSIKLSTNGSVLRSNEQSLRRIVITKRFTETKPHYLRVKSVEELETRQFHLDYIELVPSSVWESEGRD
jgi:hypothetical protein